MKDVHFLLQAKGGVGKSFIATMLAQFIRDQGELPKCYDTDPANATFTGFEALDVTRIELLDKNSEMNLRAFDPMMEAILMEDRDFVVDNGSATFQPLTNYLVQNGVFGMIEAAGKRAVVHTVVTGGQATPETVGGFEALCAALPPSVRLVVWLNEYFGEPVVDGVPFEKSPVFNANKKRVAALVKLQQLNVSTFGEDVRKMLGERMTFEEVAKSPELFGVMERQRLLMIQRSMWSMMKQVQI